MRRDERRSAAAADGTRDGEQRKRRTGSPHHQGSADARIDERQRRVGQQACRAARKIAPAPAQPATRYTSRARSASSISRPRPGPRRDHLDDKRSAEQRADHEAVHGRDRPKRRLQRVAPDDARARERPGRRRRGRTGAPIVSAIACDCSRSNIAASGSASARGGHDQVAQQVERDAARRRAGRSHAGDRQPAGARRHEDQEERRQQRRHRQQHERDGANRRRTARCRGGCPSRRRAAGRRASRGRAP